MAEINSALTTHYGSDQVPYVIYRDVSPAFLKDGGSDTSLFSRYRRNRHCTLLQKDRNGPLLLLGRYRAGLRGTRGMTVNPHQAAPRGT
jgi:hypothetical protein